MSNSPWLPATEVNEAGWWWHFQPQQMFEPEPVRVCRYGGMYVVVPYRTGLREVSDLGGLWRRLEQVERPEPLKDKSP
jgi:hypothetical protein